MDPHPKTAPKTAQEIAQDVSQAEGRIGIASDRLLLRYPLHCHVLSQMTVRAVPAIKTMAVMAHKDSEQVFLLHNPDFVLKLPMNQLVGVLLHEIHHVLFKHLAMLPKDFPNRAALIISQEVTVNEFVKEPLPKGVVKLENYPDLPPLESTVQRYKRLEKKIPSITVVFTCDNHDPTLEGLDGEYSSTLPDEILDDIIQEAIHKAKGRMPKALEDALKRHGSDPGEILEAIGRRGRHSVGWGLLRRFVGQLLQPRPIYSKPNRRFPSLIGIVPGQARQPSQPKIMAVLDTSGSINAEMLEQMNVNLGYLHKKGYSITVVEADAKINRVYRFKGYLKEVHGRGGTDLRPVFEKRFLEKHRPDLLIYFSDGYGPAPAVKPKVPVVWALVGEQARQPANWGKVIWLR